MATQYEYDKYVLQSSQIIFAFGRKLVRKDDLEIWEDHVSYVRSIMRMPPRWGIITKMRAEAMNELRSYWKNKWFNETIPEIKKVMLETTLLPEDIVNILQKYYQYPHQTKPAYVGRARWFKGIGWVWRRYDHNGNREEGAHNQLEELFEEQEDEMQWNLYLGGLLFRESMERFEEHRIVKRKLRRQMGVLVSKRAKGWDGVGSAHCARRCPGGRYCPPARVASRAPRAPRVRSATLYVVVAAAVGEQYTLG